MLVLPDPSLIPIAGRAWCAGFYDGEGCTTLVNGRQLRLTVGQQDPRVLVKFQEILLGIGHLHTPKSFKPNGMPRAYHYYITTSSHSIWAMRVMWPFLGEIKRAQYLVAKEKYIVR